VAERADESAKQKASQAFEIMDIVWWRSKGIKVEAARDGQRRTHPPPLEARQRGTRRPKDAGLPLDRLVP
jgi:hypothetical protein